MTELLILMIFPPLIVAAIILCAWQSRNVCRYMETTNKWIDIQADLRQIDQDYLVAMEHRLQDLEARR